MGWPGCFIIYVVVEGCLYGPSATERPLGTIHEDKGISSQFRVFILTRYDLSC